jgi:DNA-binding transcriptional ArsR family regulator
MPVQDAIVQPETRPITVALEPAHHAIHSLLLLTDAHRLSGLADWVTRTAAALDERQRRRNELVIVGFYKAITPTWNWSNFPTYVDHLAMRDPRTLRDRLLEAYMQTPCLAGEGLSREEDREVILHDVDNYLAFLQERFPPEHLDLELEAQAYSYVVDPPAMQDLIVSHLRTMWQEHLAAEWARVEPMLRDAVTAFGQVDLGRMDPHEAATWVTGQELSGPKWERAFKESKQIVLVPSAHVGPYLGKMWADDTFWLLFGARLPQGVRFHAPDLSRTEIVVRLGALADDTRLRILRRISEEGEMSSQEIIGALELSQSATSRHLKQLSATGYLTERRCNGAKCYRLDPERLEDTLRAVSNFLTVR